MTACRNLLLLVTAVALCSADTGPAPPPLPESAAPATRRESHDPAADTTAGLPRATAIDVIDGDTIAADIELAWNITLRDQRIRAAGFDAWETNRRRRSVNVTAAEIRKGRVATAYLTALLNGCELIVIPVDSPRDHYGRILARWYLLDSEGDLVPISDLMTQHGHTRPTEEAQ